MRVFCSILFCGVLVVLAFSTTARAQHLSPNEFTSELRLAEIYDQTHAFDDAIRLYEELHRASPENDEVFTGLVRDYFYVKRFTDVESLVQEKLKTRAGDQDLLLLLGRAEAKLNKKEEALAAFHKAESIEIASGDECLLLMPVASALVDVNYQEEALEVLKRTTSSDNIGCAGAAANLYLRLGKYADATREYLVLLKTGEGNLSLVEQRIAQFTTDSAARMLTLEALRTEIAKENPTRASLQLLAWMYGEQKNYVDAYAVVARIDSLNGTEHSGNQGFELLVFAEKARNEGALDVAVKAYDEAIKRIKAGAGKQNEYFLGQAELGALKTTEAFYAQKLSTSREEYTDLITRYEAFAASEQFPEFGLEASLRAATLSYEKLFDLKRAADNYERTITKSHGSGDRSKVAMFGLVDVSLASANFPEADGRLKAIQSQLEKRETNGELRPEDKETWMHLLYERALIDYYQTNFDSALVKLRVIAHDSASDYANDAIALGSTIAENKKAANVGALKLFAQANLAEFDNDKTTAAQDYQTLATTFTASPVTDQAMIRLANIQAASGKPEDAVSTLESMQEKLPSSPLLDEAAFREAEIVETTLHDKKRAEKMYEDFLARFPRSNFDDAARERARRLRGDVF